MIKLCIGARMPCAVFILGETKSLFGTEKTVFELDEGFINSGADTKLLMKLSPYCGLDEEYRLLDECVLLSLSSEGGETRLMLDPSADEGAAEVYRWGCGIYEIEPRFKRLRIKERPPEKLAETEFTVSGQQAKLKLFCDGGLMLESCVGEAERSYSLGAGFGGSMRAIDTGRSKILLVFAETVSEESSALPRPEKRTRVIMLNENLDSVGEISANECYMESGYLCAVETLGTVLGHEAKRMYEPSAAGAIERGGAEVGYFTHGKHAPETYGDTALAFLECLLLGRSDESMSFLTPELIKSTDVETIAEFFGEFDEVRKAPFESENGAELIGTVSGGVMQVYAFSFENGLIGDISEYLF